MRLWPENGGHSPVYGTRHGERSRHHDGRTTTVKLQKQRCSHTRPTHKPTVCLGVLSMSLWSILLSSQVAALDIKQCQKTPEALGMQSRAIPDEALSASSSYDPKTMGPTSARIRTEQGDGAWCPRQKVNRDVYEYLQIDLGELKVITMLETQGRFGNGKGREFAEFYLLEYQREDDGNWIRFRNRMGQETLRGNTNTYNTEMQPLEPPVLARRIRFIPYSEEQRAVCMRVEVYGCTWKDGILSYDMQKGDRRGTEVDLCDYSYDGRISDNYLSGGLGQLTDGDLGESNFRLDSRNLGLKGYEWVGWRNDTWKGKPVEIIFKFDTVRNFTMMTIHCNNMYNKDIRVFKKAHVYFSIGGEQYMEDYVEYDFERDTLMEYARKVPVPLNHHIGRFVKVHLFFDAKWLLISEVQFDSEIASGDFLTSHLGLTTVTTQGSVPVTPGVLNENIDSPTPSIQGSSEPGNDAPGEADKFDAEHIGIVIGALCAIVVILLILVAFIFIRNRRRKHAEHQAIKVDLDTPHNLMLNSHDNQGNSMNGKMLNGNMYNSVATSDMDGEHGGSTVQPTFPLPPEYMQSRRLPEVPMPQTPESIGTNISREYAVPDLPQSPLLMNIPPTAPPLPITYHPTLLPPGPAPPPPPRLAGGSPYAAADIGQLPSIQGISGGSVYSVAGPDLWKEQISVMEFPRSQLKQVEKLGEGQFGEVHLCEALGMSECLDEDFLVNRTGSRAVLVAVKMLRRNASESARLDFQKEVRLMSRLQDPNIVRVLGVCSQEEPLCVIVEYMKYGDLHQFLQQYVPEGTTSSKRKANKTLSHGCLIYMVTQIASGMKYLESLNMIHRDLATRNCLVGDQFTIKISDFGMSRSLYSSDYYRMEGRAVLPIRWMAWESILLGKFTAKSDVWSFGVTLWEVLTFAREQPYDNMTDEQVIENCGHYFRDDGLEVVLPQPAVCPREVYDLMRQCWSKEAGLRPAFHEIHLFLHRNNMGYKPQEDRSTLPKTASLTTV